MYSTCVASNRFLANSCQIIRTFKKLRLRLEVKLKALSRQEQKTVESRSED